MEVGAAYYSTPPGWIGRLVPMQWDALHVRILHVLASAPLAGFEVTAEVLPLIQREVRALAQPLKGERIRPGARQQEIQAERDRQSEAARNQRQVRRRNPA